MSTPTPFLSGTVEGFYGREWPWAERRHHADFLRAQGCNTYLYCPKGDEWLRRRWAQPWPGERRAELEALAQHCRQGGMDGGVSGNMDGGMDGSMDGGVNGDMDGGTKGGLNWGVGLSPYALYQNYGAAERRQLRAKVAEIDSLGGNLLAVLFDDMPGDCPDLAARQAEILADVAAWSGAEVLLTCPTYYSLDPVLERVFGPRPPDYWAQFGAQVPARYGIFWCGNQVCPASVTAADIAPIADALGRAPVLWDNYPVNDGERASRFLHLAPLPGRAPGLHRALAGHLCNPMNQPRLSRCGLSGLAALLGGAAPAPEAEATTLEAAVEALYGDALGPMLARDRGLFEDAGLDGMDGPTKGRLIARYGAIDHPAAAEVVDWLQEGYRFDPACLTG